MIVWISRRWETQQLARSSKALAGDNYSAPPPPPCWTLVGGFRAALGRTAQTGKINGREFVRRAKRFAARNGLDFRFERGERKGSHGQLYVGRRQTMVKRTELSKVLLRNMLRDLGINKEDF